MCGVVLEKDTKNSALHFFNFILKGNSSKIMQLEVEVTEKTEETMPLERIVHSRGMVVGVDEGALYISLSRGDHAGKMR